MTYIPPEGVTIGSFTADTMPASFSAPADAVVTYKIYGTSEGAGVETGSGEPAGYKLPLTVESGEQSQDIPIYIGNSKLGEEEYVDYGEQKVYKKKPNLVSDVLSHVTVSSDGTLNRNPSLNSAVTPIEQGKTYTILYAREGTGNMICGFFENYPAMNDVTYDGNRFLWSGEYYTIVAPIDGYLASSCSPEITAPVVYEGEYPQLAPTDPPVPLPTITATGETTISSTETLGDIELTGDWLTIMGSTEAESIDIGFTVDADEYIAFASVDDGPSIQVSDTITMPSSADSFSLEVVAWGREQYTDTVYNALS